MTVRRQARVASVRAVQADGRLAIIVGLALWGAAFVVLAVIAGIGADADGPIVRWLWTCLLGLFLGGVGLLYVQLKRR